MSSPLLIVTPWKRDGRLRARCPKCLTSSDFTDIPETKRKQAVSCPECGQTLRFNALQFARLPVWEDSAPELPFGRFALSEDDRTILTALAKAVDHQREPLRRRPRQVLPQLAMELKFRETAVMDWLESWPHEEHGPWELLSRTGWACTDARLLRTFESGSAVSSVAVSPDGRRWISEHDDSTLRLWEVDTQGNAQCVELLEWPHTIMCLAVPGPETELVNASKKNERQTQPCFRVAIGDTSGQVSVFQVDPARIAALPKGAAS